MEGYELRIQKVKNLNDALERLIEVMNEDDEDHWHLTDFIYAAVGGNNTLGWPVLRSVRFEEFDNEIYRDDDYQYIFSYYIHPRHWLEV